MSPTNQRDVHEMTEAEHRVEYPAIASLEDMKLHRLPLNYRDLCSKHLINLNMCRKETFYMPWKCQPERHNWEICQYKDFLRRMRKASRLRAEAAAEGGKVDRIDTPRNLWDVKKMNEEQD